MPFQSEKQRRYLWANEPEIARDWTDTYGSRIQKKNGGIMSIQGGVENYEPSEMVNVPRKAKSSPDHPSAHLAYITDKEQDLLVKMNLYGSLKGKPNRGPAGIPSLQGDFGGPGGAYGGHEGADVSGSRDTGTGDYRESTRPADVAARNEFEQSFGITGGKPKGFLQKGIDLYSKYGVIPNVYRGVKNLFSPRTEAEKVQANINKGYDVNNPAEMHGLATRTGPVDKKDGQQQYIPPQYINDLYAQNVMEEDGLDIDTSTGDMEDWSQRFRVDDQYRQDQGALDEQIREYISTLYT